jgi:hypothetical protein
MLPIAKLVWRKQLNKLLQTATPIEAPESIKQRCSLKNYLQSMCLEHQVKRKKILEEICIYRKWKNLF